MHKGLVRKLKAQASAGKSEKISFENFDKLPAPVAKYFRLVLNDGQSVIRTAQLKLAVNSFRLELQKTGIKSEAVIHKIMLVLSIVCSAIKQQGGKTFGKAKASGQEISSSSTSQKFRQTKAKRTINKFTVLCLLLKSIRFYIFF